MDVIWPLPAGVITRGNRGNGSQMAPVRLYPLSIPKYTEFDAYPFQVRPTDFLRSTLKTRGTNQILA